MLYVLMHVSFVLLSVTHQYESWNYLTFGHITIIFHCTDNYAEFLQDH